MRDFESIDIKSSYASEMKRKIDYLRGKKGEKSPKKVPKLVINIDKSSEKKTQSSRKSPKIKVQKLKNKPTSR